MPPCWGLGSSARECTVTDSPDCPLRKQGSYLPGVILEAEVFGLSLEFTSVFVPKTILIHDIVIGLFINRYEFAGT
jgi:hypothetical protein